jgi:LytS/YehU family sensor histidine kinase
LENSEEDFIPLNKEIELLELYMKLEHSRFPEKFDYSFEVDPHLDVEGFTIPPMLLQPYIENAIWHGLRYKEEKGKLKVALSPIGSEKIKIVITDDGIGRKQSKLLKTKNQKKQKSKGMGNIQRRIAILNALHAEQVKVDVNDLMPDGSGTRVELELARK